MKFNEGEESAIIAAEMQFSADNIASASDVTQSEAEFATAQANDESLSSDASDFERFASYMNVNETAERHRKGLTHASRLDRELNDLLDPDKK